METVVLSDQTTNTNGFVGYSAELNIIVISFSGTDPLSIRNWVVDISTRKVPFTGYGANSSSYVVCPGDCKVHKGFYEAYLAVAAELRSAVLSFQEQAPAPPAIVATGHSLGAALAQHAAIDLSSTNPSAVTSLYNYGQPRTGNEAFANFSASLLGEKTFRVTHHKDPVPQLPFQSWNFHHEVLEVFYAAEVFKAGDYNVCAEGNGEDPSCSDQYALDLNVLDHLTYMGFDFTANYLLCKF
jgi:predicted lipase